jgi:hypothetical protein
MLNLDIKAVSKIDFTATNKGIAKMQADGSRVSIPIAIGIIRFGCISSLTLFI